MLRVKAIMKEGRFAEICGEISAIVDAVMRNDAIQAAAACKRHVEQSGRHAIEVFMGAA